MKKKLLLAVSLFVMSITAAYSYNDDGCCRCPQGCKTDSVKLDFFDKGRAKVFLSQSDNYTRSLSSFDLKMYIGGDNAAETDYLSLSAEAACEWSDSVKALLAGSAARLNKMIKAKNLKLGLPANGMPIMLTTMKEAGDAGGYTRGTAIVLSKSLLERYVKENKVQKIDALLAHELFHVLTRTNPDFRRAMYSCIGFTVLPEAVKMPAALKDRSISNPDVNAHDSYATFDIGGKPTDCAMIIYSDRAYTGGSLFDYIKVGLLEINHETSEPLLADGRYKIHAMGEATDFYKKVGENTGYVIDPEEVLASNFVYILLVDDYSKAPTPDLLKRLENVCKGLQAE